MWEFLKRVFCLFVEVFLIEGARSLANYFRERVQPSPC